MFLYELCFKGRAGGVVIFKVDIFEKGINVDFYIFGMRDSRNNVLYMAELFVSRIAFIVLLLNKLEPVLLEFQNILARYVSEVFISDNLDKVVYSSKPLEPPVRIRERQNSSM